jgi:hypothetical protein
MLGLVAMSFHILTISKPIWDELNTDVVKPGRREGDILTYAYPSPLAAPQTPSDNIVSYSI